ncbi:MAG: hypothetical protein A3H96_11335 [Acidobacteria bacterium RIFCSPLOWO2_02_FULL_67_36]|nr:MAG: hypothetical protein A3H96_11335 [Acidobacteria bacterium RIFCSPLOWO2_02_FULL_67_36]OFW40515.1 MAG: hypothetical protein A3F70_00940 [Acidobacteria bacterium RIFCSPLOWO2_12_FULL_67_14]
MIVPMVGPRFERVGWPAIGGAGEQDAWLTAAIECVRDVRNAVLYESVARARRQQASGGGDD